MQDDKTLYGRWRETRLVGGHPALDFLNSVSDRVARAEAIDRLGSLADLADWVRSAGLAVSPSLAARLAKTTDKGDSVVTRARALREAAHASLTARVDGQSPPPNALALISDVAAEGMASGSLHWPQPNDTASLTLEKPDPTGLLGLIAWQILDALFRLPGERLRICPRCGWLFVDSTRGGRRRWCQMRTCGNREKARRHRRAKGPASAQTKGT